MARQKYAEDLTVDELRHLLIEKRRSARQERLEHFRRTGRVVVVSPEESSNTELEGLRVNDEPVEPVENIRQTRRGKRKRFFDRFLFVIEVGAVLGLLIVLFTGLNLLRDLNREVAVSIEQPTMTPTPLIEAVVLPSGHTPPNAPGGAQPNDSEIPEHLRPLIQSLASIPLPTPGPEQAVRIQIPAIEVDAPIVQGDGWEQLKKGVAHHAGSANPGQTGNVVLSAHNDVFGELFRNLDRLKTGDTIVLYTNQHQYTYSVSGSQVVSPTQVDVMADTHKPVVTLISCYPYMVDNQRIVVTATLQTNP